MDREFRKKMYELDEIGFIGIPGVEETEKDGALISALIQASKKMYKEQKRRLTDDEREQIIQEALCSYELVFND